MPAHSIDYSSLGASASGSWLYHQWSWHPPRPLRDAAVQHLQNLTSPPLNTLAPCSFCTEALLVGAIAGVILLLCAALTPTLAKYKVNLDVSHAGSTFQPSLLAVLCAVALLLGLLWAVLSLLPASFVPLLMDASAAVITARVTHCMYAFLLSLTAAALAICAVVQVFGLHKRQSTLAAAAALTAVLGAWAASLLHFFASFFRCKQETLGATIASRTAKYGPYQYPPRFPLSYIYNAHWYKERHRRRTLAWRYDTGREAPEMGAFEKWLWGLGQGVVWGADTVTFKTQRGWRRYCSLRQPADTPAPLNWSGGVDKSFSFTPACTYDALRVYWTEDSATNCQLSHADHMAAGFCACPEEFAATDCLRKAVEAAATDMSTAAGLWTVPPVLTAGIDTSLLLYPVGAVGCASLFAVSYGSGVLDGAPVGIAAALCALFALVAGVSAQIDHVIAELDALAVKRRRFVWSMAAAGATSVTYPSLLAAAQEAGFDLGIAPPAAPSQAWLRRNPGPFCRLPTPAGLYNVESAALAATLLPIYVLAAAVAGFLVLWLWRRAWGWVKGHPHRR